MWRLEITLGRIVGLGIADLFSEHMLLPRLMCLFAAAWISEFFGDGVSKSSSPNM
jgi:hypothetical protein